MIYKNIKTNDQASRFPLLLNDMKIIWYHMEIVFYFASFCKYIS